MTELTEAGRRIVDEIAQRHGVGADAVITLLGALALGHGTQAQFNHPELGGMGQWSQGGMIMVGDMFNQGLKYRVDALCTELATLLRGETPLFAPPPVPAPATQHQSQAQSHGGGAGVSLFVSGIAGSRWPADLGSPASTGSQNDLHYAVFPVARRLAISQGGRVTVYDTADHIITGFSQQQGGGQSLTFTSQHGLVGLESLRMVDAGTPAELPPVETPSAARPAPAPAPAPAPWAHATSTAVPSPPAAAAIPPRAGETDDEIFAKIERLADLHDRGILTAEEFAAKKTELLARL